MSASPQSVVWVKSPIYVGDGVAYGGGRHRLEYVIEEPGRIVLTGDAGQVDDPSPRE